MLKRFGKTEYHSFLTKQVTVGRDEGAVTEEGTPFDATEMNDLENRIYAAIEQGGGGGGSSGTYDYTELFNKPRINNHELDGNQSAEDLGLVDNSNYNAENLPISASDTTNTKDYIDTKLSGKVDTGACVSFALDYPSSITGLVKYANGCYYNPQTNEVHINIVIYSNQNNIPNNGGVIATIPSAYRPNAERVVASFADILDSNNALHFEAIQPIGTNGEIKLHNFVYAGNINTICMNFVFYK